MTKRQQALAVVTIHLLVLLMAALAAPAHAATFLDINFDADTSGAAPSTSYPGWTMPVTELWAIGGYSPGFSSPPDNAAGTIAVGNAAGISKGVLLTTNAANPAIGALWLDTAFAATAQQIRLSFDLNILAAPTEATSQPKFLAGSGDQAGILLGMNAFTSEDWAYRFAVAPTSDDGGVFSFRTPDNTELVSFFDYREGITYHLDFDINYSEGTLNAYVDGDLKLANFAFWTSGAENVTTQEFFFHLNGEDGNANSVAIDNILAQSVEPVPEPSTLVIAGLLLVGTAMRHRPFRFRSHNA